jgi:hypothetical protein
LISWLTGFCTAGGTQNLFRQLLKVYALSSVTVQTLEIVSGAAFSRWAGKPAVHRGSMPRPLR